MGRELQRQYGGDEMFEMLSQMMVVSTEVAVVVNNADDTVMEWASSFRAEGTMPSGSDEGRFC